LDIDVLAVALNTPGHKIDRGEAMDWPAGEQDLLS